MTMAAYISLAIIWFLFAFCYRDYRIARLRETLFSMRDDLFDLACDNAELNFDDDAYTMLRSRLNSTIRYAHKIRILDLILTLIALRHNQSIDREIAEDKSRWVASCEKLPGELQASLAEISQGVRFEVFQQMLLTSALFWLTIAPAVCFIVAKRAYANLATSMAWIGSAARCAARVLDRYDVASSQSHSIA